jgi:hypothetical protein
MADILYKTWVDRGGYVGIQCLTCKRTHWNENVPTIFDPTTGEDCKNCQSIRDSKVRADEQLKHDSEKEDCEHDQSQPNQQHDVAA